MNRLQLRALLDEVRSGTLTPEAAHEQLLQYLRHSPYENLDFARVDHHRSVRQGFPEVVYGPGKTPERDMRAGRMSTPEAGAARSRRRPRPGE